MNQKPHIKIQGYFENLKYLYPKIGFSDNLLIFPRNRNVHGNFLADKINQIKNKFELRESDDIELISENVTYIEFYSEWNYELSFDSLDLDGINQNKKIFQILNIKKVVQNDNEFRYLVVVAVNIEGINYFLKKITKYLTDNSFKTDKNTKEKIDTGNPINQKLINNIQNIEIATLKSFWVDEPEIPFPNENEFIWWEVWFRKSDSSDVHLDKIFSNLQNLGCIVGQSQINFTDHIVKLIKGTANQLTKSLFLFGNLSELRKPQQTSDFINHRDITFQTKSEYQADLLKRTISSLTENSVLICLFDSGVNNLHPLLNQFMPDENLYSYNSSWGLNDTEPNGGHGTGVAGLAIYGDLAEVLSGNNDIEIFHGLESYKIYHHNHVNNPLLYGAIIESGVSTPVIDRPNNLRVYCLTVTHKEFRFKGRPSSWSAAIDKICFGTNDSQQIFIVSGGNVNINNFIEFPSLNQTEIVHDPAQSYNSIVVGTFTKKTQLNNQTSGIIALAPYNGMAPSNSTSLLFDKNWPNKPDLVFEGGNLSTDGIHVMDDPNLKLISLDAEFDKYIFMPFGDTSASAGLASKMAAEIRTKYPRFWPETIRALMIHSAYWSKEMLGNKKIENFYEHEKIVLLRTVGYGIPNLEKALYSANNSLTLIAERIIQPYMLEKSNGKYNEYHLFTLPWPKDALINLQDKDVTIKVTLSYYIEPNPGSRRFASHYQYHSHQLDFLLIKPNERLEVFKRRVSAASELDPNDIDNSGEKWVLGRSSLKGSIRKDFITISGIEMSERNIMAVYPKNGWYKNLKRKNKFNEKVRYCLIVNIETPEIEVDLYAPVEELILVKSQ